MSNPGNAPEPRDALWTLGDICREAAERHGGDFAAALETVRSRVAGLPPDDRARVDAALRDILRFQPPPSRTSQ